MFQLSQAIALLLAGSAIASPQYGVEVFKRSPPQASGIQFVCSDFPQVCQNMCWGAYCVDQKTSYLIYDKASASVKRSRRRAAGCLDNKKPGNNRCSQGRPGAIKGYNCDEYPFASSKSNTQAAGTTKENRCSRCVPSGENSKQGSVISAGYGKNGYCKGNAPCSFTVFFANQGTTPHCSPGTAGNCNADSKEQCSGPISVIQRDLITRDTLGLEHGVALANGTVIPGPAQIITHKGQVLQAPYGGVVGQPIYNPVPINRTLWEEQTEAHEVDEDAGHEQYEYIAENLRVETDWLVGVV